MAAKIKPLPFSIRANSPPSLTEQVVRGLSRAIRSGYYKPGDRIQPILAVAETLGVSAMVVRNALKRLSAIGVLAARPRSGIRVRGFDAPFLWRAHVLQLAWTANTSYYYAARQQVFHELLREAKVRLSVALINDRDIAAGLPGVQSIADADLVDLAVFEGYSAGVISVLEKREIPFVHMCDAQPATQAVGSLVQDTKGSLAALVRHGVACRARRVLGVFMAHDQAAMAFEDAVCAKGVGCEILAAKGPGVPPNPENVEEGGLRAMQSHLARISRLPDLIYFADDYIARGGLTALADAGKRVPEDVQVVTHANLGNRIAYPRELTRMEMDPEAMGRAMAELVLGIVGRSRHQRYVVLPGPRLVPGETTLLRRKGRP